MKIAIIGAGAAGCFLAANLPQNKNLEVVIFEKTTKAMQKIKVSGGGRCNVTNACDNALLMAQQYPRGQHLLKKTLHHFSSKDCQEWFEKRNVPLKTEPDGRVFPCSDDSQSIINAIWSSLMQNNIKVHFQKAVTELIKLENAYKISFADHSHYIADKVIIATGGYQKIEQFHYLNALQLPIIQPVPSLFTFNLPQHSITQLMGISTSVGLKILGTKIHEQGPLLITHWGLSGPVVLRSSAWAARILHEKNYHFTVSINWLKDLSDEDLKNIITHQRKTFGKQQLSSKNPFAFAKRLWDYLLETASIPQNTRWAELSAVQQQKLSNLLLRHTFEVKGKTTFKEEFVSCGGIALNALDSSSYESKTHQGLYCCGEAIDVDGITGGYNFQNAWSGAWLIAQHIIRQLD